MATGKNFEYLGNTFQLQLLNQIIVDKDFSHSIIDVIENNYFENKYFKIIIQMYKTGILSHSTSLSNVVCRYHPYCINDRGINPCYDLQNHLLS